VQMTKRVVYLADLTHNGLVLSSNVFPLSIGLVGAYLCDRRRDQVEVELFKYPEDLSAALEQKTPDLLGFANYSWNYHLSRQYAHIAKKKWPGIVTVFGGPNYGLADEEIDQFWKINTDLDFYVAQEGEEAFVHLFDRLNEVDFKVEEIRRNRFEIGNVHYQVGDEMLKGPSLPRLDLEEIPSPYLMGLMDKFFDKHLGPMIHTTRGCPFKCTFCTEGSTYYNRVSQRESQLEQELNYISQRVIGPKDLYISDANFGMYKNDYDKAIIISECQKKYGYPEYIHVSTGKNQKERVVDIVKKLNGAVNMAASLQSTDPDVLENISRSNISVRKLSGAAKAANTVNMGTYSELILGLPGDSVAAHTRSLRDTVEMGFDNIRMYQLIMLPQTALNTPATRDQYEMKTKHRIMPRSYGRYSIAEETFVSVESEEILISNSTLSFEDYLICRELDLTIEILHNGKVFAEIQGLCKGLDLSWFDFIQRFFENRRNYSDEITKMYDDFRSDSVVGLWDSAQELESHVRGNINEMMEDDRGTNEMSAGKAAAFFLLFPALNKIVFSVMEDWLRELGRLDDVTHSYLADLCRYSLLRKQDLLKPGEELTGTFSFDMIEIETHAFQVRPKAVELPSTRSFQLIHNSRQRETISSYENELGGTFDGLGKLLMRYPHIHRLFRKPTVIG